MCRRTSTLFAELLKTRSSAREFTIQRPLPRSSSTLGSIHSCGQNPFPESRTRICRHRSLRQTAANNSTGDFPCSRAFEHKSNTHRNMNKKIIGTNAGIIWNLLNNNQKWSITQLQEASGLSEKEIYSAIGWLARENKIEIDKTADNKEAYYLVIEYYF